MSLSSYRVGAVVAVSDMSRACEFYEGKLGLRPSADEPDGGRTYQCGEKTAIHVFPSPGDAGASGATVAGPEPRYAARLDLLWAWRAPQRATEDTRRDAF
jgi:catechol 2,3-dioxygenase-like lactoylglutathione lyase family enzyme